MLEAFRGGALEVIYTVIENLTQDGRDRSLDYKLSDFNFAKGSWESRVVEEIAPQGDEIVLPKTSSSVFNSTSLDYLLRNIGIEDVFVTGFLTDQCVDHTVRDGADRGYYMTCVRDACTAETGRGMRQRLTASRAIAACLRLTRSLRAVQHFDVERLEVAIRFQKVRDLRDLRHRGRRDDACDAGLVGVFVGDDHVRPLVFHAGAGT